MCTVSREREEESEGGEGRGRQRRHTVATTWKRLRAKLDPRDGAAVPSAVAQLQRQNWGLGGREVSSHEDFMPKIPPVVLFVRIYSN